MAFTVGLKGMSHFLPELAGFPFYASRDKVKWTGPMTLIYGTKSEYVPPDQHALIREQFPTCQFIPMETGHWCHAEKPREFLRTVTELLNK